MYAHLFSFLLSKYIGVEGLSDIVCVYLTFKETDKLFSKVVVSFYIPPANVGAVISHPCQHLWLSVFLNLVTLVGVVLYHRCSSWASFPVFISSFRFLLKSSADFLVGLFISYIWVFKRSLCILDSVSLLDICIANIFFLCGLPFYLINDITQRADIFSFKSIYISCL